MRGPPAKAARVAALYDIHGNLPALEAVLREVLAARVDRVVVGGDVLPGPMPRESLALLLALDLPLHFVRGNGEREALMSRRGEVPPGVPARYLPVTRWAADQLLPEQVKAIEAWPLTVSVEFEELGEVLFCHATPASDNEIFTEATPERRLRAIFAGVDARVVVCGHTHMQFDRTIGKTRVVNAGSVGMPFGEPGADWLLLGPDVELRHTAYDLARAAERIRATTYPEDFAARYVLNPPAAAQMLDVFTAFSLKEGAGRW